ncbi:TetR family transcriptional regulator [Cohnella nanjingensis]|uniref:TetR/AcrR family transcriptional regulator n=1 Tax=Cohnella nanjingensis TaxID=1387779 RepID=A0A7X0RUM2_9BACL|nr:TetR family transcriptional regulator [Cohnella nanjingensis]MBB6674022.1 TetR/AcrR family transcriptional regulator [Cohnella nanjingensis]
MESTEQDVKRRLLLAAKKLFARQGFDGTTIRQICEEAGANVALVSYYFGGKDKIFEAVIETFFPHDSIRERFAESMEPVNGVRAVIREVILYRSRDPELVQLIQNESSHDSPRTEIIRKHLIPIWTRMRDLLEQGKREGVFRFRSLDNTFLYIWGGLLFHREFNLFDPILADAPPTAEQLTQDLTDFVLGALHCGAAAGNETKV